LGSECGAELGTSFIARLSAVGWSFGTSLMAVGTSWPNFADSKCVNPVIQKFREIESNIFCLSPAMFLRTLHGVEFQKNGLPPKAATTLLPLQWF
jgi:hypothetical protein